MMGVTRKELLAGSAALAVAGCGGKTVGAAPPPSTFALAPGWRHFDAFLFAAHPEARPRGDRASPRGLDQGAADYLRRHEGALDEAVAVAGGRTRGAAADACVHGLDHDGARADYRGLLRPGDEVLTTEHDHYATHESLRLSGAAVRKVRCTTIPQRPVRRHDRRAERCAHGPHEGRRADLGPLGDRRQAPLVKRGPRSATRHARRRRRARARRRGRPGRHPPVRRAGRRHTQVAGRPARHRDHLDAEGLGQVRPVIPSFGSEPYGAWMRAALSTRSTWSTWARGSRPAATTRSSTAGRWRRRSTGNGDSAARRSPIAPTGSRSASRTASPRMRHVAWSRRGPRRSPPGSSASRSRARARVGRLTPCGARIRASVTPYAEAHVRLGTSLHVDAATSTAPGL